MARDMGSKDDAHPIEGGTVTNQSPGFTSFVSGSPFPPCHEQYSLCSANGTLSRII
jgi:hypothetical protein